MQRIENFRTLFPHLDQNFNSSCGFQYFLVEGKKCRNTHLSIVLAQYPERELNPHTRNEYRILSPACLPVPPSGHGRGDFVPELNQLKKPSSEGLFFRAKDGIRTRDPNLGKVVLYQLSYFRIRFGVANLLKF